VEHSVKKLYAGWGRRLKSQPQVPTLRTFVIGLVALFMVCVGMAQLRAALWFDANLLAGGGIALWLWRVGSGNVRRDPLIGPDRLATPRWWLASLLAITAVGIAVWQWRNLSVSFPTDADWLWYLATIGVLVIAAAVMEPWQFPWRRGLRLHGALWALLAIVLLAAAIRFLFLANLPFGTWYDEAANGLEAMRVAHEPAYRPIYTDGVNSTGHYLWLIVGAFRLFGESTYAVRSISALMGVATVLAAYFAGREWHSHTLGLIFALLMAVARWSITFSRLGMYNSATLLFELLAFYWLLRALRRGSVLDFALAGVAVGLGLCFYPAFQLFLGVLGLFVLVVAWRERSKWRSLVIGLAVSLLALLLVIAPVAKYALERPESYFARVQKTSLFSGKAPEERLPALWENTRKHLLMFNVQGDPNGRHNLPGEPMLDWVSGGLLVVGLVMSLRHVYLPRLLVLPVWIVVGLLGGILSLDFEAPQSLRAIGALPAVLLCAALPIAALAEEWRQGGGRYFPEAGLWILALVILLPVGAINLHGYFGRQANDFAAWNAHSTPETITARLLRDADPSVEKYVISLFDSHPTVRFLARDVVYRRVETNTTLPLLREMPNGMMLILDAERRALYEEARRLYPNAAFQEIRPPNSGPVVVYVNHLSPQDIQSVQGLFATYSKEGGEISAQVRKELTIDAEWPDSAPVELPFVAEWRGVLAANTYGPHQFFVEAPGEVTLWIGESTVLEGDGAEVEGLGGALMLARGHHTIRLRAEGGVGRVRLAWQPPDGPPSTVPSWALYVPPVQSNGLLGRYFNSGDWSGEAAFAQIDPRLAMYFHVPVLARPYTVEWSGKLAIPESGHYDFGLQSIDESTLMIDGMEIAASRVRNEMAIGSVTLEAGLHDMVVLYADRTDHTYINLSWRTPGGDMAFRMIPSELLFPPQSNYDQVDIGDLARFVQSDTPLPTEVVRDLYDPARVDVVASGLAQPRGVVVLDGLVYVAESGAQRVSVFDAATGEALVSPFESLALVEPFDLAAHADGSIDLLDTGAGQLLRFDPEAGVINAIPVAAELVNRSRGIGAGAEGAIWIANTPGQRIVVVDSGGALLQEIFLPAVTTSETELQPVDVAVMPDNSLYVTDAGGHSLYRFSLAGYLVSSQPIPVANSLDGAHLAVDGAGKLYMTEPEAGRVVQLDPSGIIEHIWSVRTNEAADAKPVGLAVAVDGAVWVVDSQGGRLLRVMPEANE
jgi:4-amino-4-deoxy-L-arabinose transferase-like glycosyltransferase/DNA-binding beta-propeller fold protein YncE